MKLTKITLTLVITISIFGLACSSKPENANLVNSNANAATPINMPTPEVKIAAPTPEIPPKNSRFQD